MKSITTSNYLIHFSDDDALREFLSAKAYSRYLVIVDENTSDRCLPFLKKISKQDFKIINTPSGEWNKNLDTCKSIWDQMIAHGADRYSLCINLGGGVIGDMGGFCAASYMRGMDFIQIPTTLLAMVDASVGGKLGIDFQKKKNYIGLFAEPSAVFIYPRFLKTLEFRQLKSGFAELLKHALIADTDLWDTLKYKEVPSVKKLGPLLRSGVDIKKNIVATDPKEAGQRKVLNFGHTIGHALESYFLDSDNPLLHGEAVAMGMICEAFISYQKGLISEHQYFEIYGYLSDFYGDVRVDDLDKEQLILFCKADKKNRNQEISFSLLNGIGAAIFDQSVEDELIISSFDQIIS